MIIETNYLKKLVNSVSIGVGNNKLVPITGFIQITAVGDMITLKSTDGLSTYTIFGKDVGDEDKFDVVVNANSFIKLIKKMDCKEIQLVASEDSLKIIGNGEYSLDVKTDVDGQKFSISYEVAPAGEHKENDVFKLNDIKSVANSLIGFLSSDVSTSHFTQIYFGKNAVATDRFIMGMLDIKLFDSDVLVDPSVVKFLKTTATTDVAVYLYDEYVSFITADFIVVSRRVYDINQYPVESMTKLLSDTESYKGSVYLDKLELLNTIERIEVVSDPYDNGVVSMVVEPAKVTISTPDGINCEVLECSNYDVPETFKCKLSLSYLKSVVKSHTGDEVRVYLNNPRILKIKSDELTSVMALSNG